MIWALLGCIGIFVGVFGTLIGAAGGFMLVPILLFLYPQETPATITSITLTVAFFNSLSGSIGYGRLKRIDYHSGFLFSAASVPGAIIGASMTTLLNKGIFEIIFGLILLLVSGYLMIRPHKQWSEITIKAGQINRELIDTSGDIFSYSFNLTKGIIIAFLVGLMSGLLGIGGGIMHVPALIHLLGFPAHVATATSHFVLAITTFSAIVTHIVKRTFTGNILRIIILSAGAIIGAQIGARLSQKVTSIWIVRFLAIGLALVAIRLLIAQP